MSSQSITNYQCSECSVTDEDAVVRQRQIPRAVSVDRHRYFWMLDALVITLPKSWTYTWEKWMFSGMNSVYCRRLLAQTCSFLRWLDKGRPSMSHVRIRRVPASEDMVGKSYI